MIGLPKLTRWQRAGCLALAVIIAALTYHQFDEGDLTGIEWLLPVLICGALVLVAGQPGRNEQPAELSLPSGASLNPQADQIEARLARTKSLARRIAEFVEFPLHKFPDKQLSNLEDWGKLNIELWALLCAYSAMYFRPRRHLAAIPDGEEFQIFRKRVLLEVNFMTSELNVMDAKIDGTRAEGLTPHGWAVHLLKEADDRRIRAEQEVNLVLLTAPMLRLRLDLDQEASTQMLVRLTKLIADDWHEQDVVPSVMALQALDERVKAVHSGKVS